MTVNLSRWAKSFALSSVTGSSAFVSHLASSADPSKAFGQLYPVPNVPGEHYGNVGAGKLAIVAIGMDLGGYGAPGDFRFKIWDSTGASKYTSDRLRSWASSTSATDLPRFSLDITSGESDDLLGNVDQSAIPILETGSFIGGTTSFRFGAYITNGFDVAYQLQTNASYNVHQDTSITTTGTFNVNTTTSGKSLIGRVYYILVPTTPGTPVEDTSVPKVRQIGVTWSASNSGGDPDGLYYRVEWQKLGWSYWNTEFPTENKITITGLEDGENYYFRVRAENGTNLYMVAADGEDGAASGWSYSDLISTASLPNWGDYTIASSAEVYKPYSDGVFAYDATSYAITSGSLPPGLSLNTATGAITGSPISMGTYSFTVSASSIAGTISQALSLTVTGSVNILDASGNTTSAAVKVYNGSAWVAGTVYVWDLTYTGTGGTHWRQIK